MSWMSKVDIICAIISLIAIFQWLFIAGKKIFEYFSDLKFLKQVLQFNSKSCCVSLSIFRKDIVGSSHDYITLNAVQSYQKLAALLKKREIMIEPLSAEYKNNNIIYIEGPSANIEVCSILTRFNGFKYYTGPDQKAIFQKNRVNQHFIVYSNEKRGFMFGDKFFEIQKDTKDMGVFIRIPQDKKRGILFTTHIIFAVWDIGTYKAVEFFIQNYKIISRMFKNKPYCFVIPISRIDNSSRIISVSEIQDVSREFFKGTDIDV